MAIKLYRKGNTHRVSGIECEVGMFPARSGNSMVGTDGWCASIEDLEKKEIECTEPEKEAQPDNNDIPQDVREMAKAAGIEGWDKKRINTLKGELDGKGE